MGPVVIIPFVIVMTALMLYIGYASTQRQAQVWTEIAAELGLVHERLGSWHVGRIAGTIDGHAVEVKTVVRGSGKNRKTYTVIQTLLHPPLGIGLRVYREHLFSGLGKLLGFQDIQTGDADFDARFAIKGKDEHAVHEILSSEVRAAIVQYDQLVAAASVDDDGVALETRGVMTDKQRIAGVLREQSKVVQALAARYRAFPARA